MQRYWSKVIPLAALMAAVAAPATASATCYIFVHGHRTTPTTSIEQARTYWQKNGQDMVGLITLGNTEAHFNQTSNVRRINQYYIVNYPTHLIYWDAAPIVAAQINNAMNGGADGLGNTCKKGSTVPSATIVGQDFQVVAHSMGTVVMDFIVGNSRPGDPWLNYQGAPFSAVTSKISYVMSIGGPHAGTRMANQLCSGGWVNENLNALAYRFYGNYCDAGTMSLQTSGSWPVGNWMNSPGATTMLFAGLRNITGANLFLETKNNDGLVEIGSAHACGWDTGVACSGHMKPYGFNTCDYSDEDHSDQTNNSRASTRWSAGTPQCWWGRPSKWDNEFFAVGAIKMTTAEMIRCNWGPPRVPGDTACRTDI